VSLILIPTMVANFLAQSSHTQIASIALSLSAWLQNQWVYGSLYFFLIVVFTYFYTAVVFDPVKISENLQKQGAFIQGVRPGNTTSDYLKSVGLRLTIVGAIFLALVSVLPNLLIHFGFMTASVISGTGLLIVIGVVLDVKRQVESMMVVRRYDKYL